MRKLSNLLFALPLLLLGCGEAGVESDISKISEISFDITATDLNISSGQTIGESVDFGATDFEEYTGQAQLFTLNDLKIEVSGLTGAPTATLNIEIRIDFNNNVALATDGDVLLTVVNLPVANTTSPILLFNTDATNPGLANATVVAALEDALLNGRAVQIEITASKMGPNLTEDFAIKFLFDLTARVDLEL